MKEVPVRIIFGGCPYGTTLYWELVEVLEFIAKKIVFLGRSIVFDEDRTSYPIGEFDWLTIWSIPSGLEPEKVGEVEIFFDHMEDGRSTTRNIFCSKEMAYRFVQVIKRMTNRGRGLDICLGNQSFDSSLPRKSGWIRVKGMAYPVD